MHDKAPFLNYHFALVLIIHAYIRRPPICQYKKKEIFTLYISVKQSTIEKAREKAVFQSTFFVCNSRSLTENGRLSAGESSKRK